MSALWVFVVKILSILWLFILKDLGKIIKICEADCGTKIIKIVWDYAEAILGLWYCIVSRAKLRLY